jgi:hypothetical protein
MQKVWTKQNGKLFLGCKKFGQNKAKQIFKSAEAGKNWRNSSRTNLSNVAEKAITRNPDSNLLFVAAFL